MDERTLWAIRRRTTANVAALPTLVRSGVPGAVLRGRQHLSRAGRQRGGLLWLWLRAPRAV